MKKDTACIPLKIWDTRKDAKNMVIQSKFVSQGLPLLLLTVGGWFTLSQFVKNRIDAQEAQRTHVDERAPVEKQRAKKFNLEDEAERIRKHHLENEYSNKPISRS